MADGINSLNPPNYSVDLAHASLEMPTVRCQSTKFESSFQPPFRAIEKHIVQSRFCIVYLTLSGVI